MIFMSASLPGTMALLVVGRHSSAAWMQLSLNLGELKAHQYFID